MKKLVISALCGSLLGVLALAGPVRGDGPPPPPPPPNGGTPLPTIGAPCPPSGCPTDTPTITPTATATPLPTATNTPVPVTISLKLAHTTVKAGSKQSVTVNTVSGAFVKITAHYPNKSKKTHTGHAGASGSLKWSFKQPSGKTTKSSRSVKVTARASHGGLSKSTSKSYKIG